MLATIISAWLVFFALRLLISSSRGGDKWLAALAARGVRFSLFHMSYETRIFNNFFFSYFNTKDAWRRRLYTKWFDIGSVCMAIGQILSLVLLTVSLAYSLQEFFSYSDPVSSSYPRSYNPSMRGATPPPQPPVADVSPAAPGSGVGRLSGGTAFVHSSSGYTPTIAPIIPGVNFPIEYVVEFWLVTFFVIAVHEFGHAAAASLERLQIQGCGTFFMFLFPGAYVRIEESVMYLPVKSQLRIYSAGILHNLAMAAASVLLVLNLPLLLVCLGFTIPGDSLVVVSQDPFSVLRGHIRMGDHIGFLNDIPVTSLASLSNILSTEHSQKPFLTSIPYGTDGGSVDSHIRQKYQPLWMTALNTSSALEFNSEVYYGSGVCVPPSILEQSSHKRHHHIRHHNSGTAGAITCCPRVLLKNYDSSLINPVDEEFYQSCFMTAGNDNSHDLIHEQSEKNDIDLHCLSAKEALVPRVSVGSHGLQETSRQMCFTDSDCMGSATPVPYDSEEGDNTGIKSGESTAPHRCVHPLTASPVHLFSIRLLPDSLLTSSLSSEETSIPGKTVLFEGTLPELMSNFELGEVDLFPFLKRNLNSWFYGMLLQMPKTIALCLWLSIQLNLSVAFMNMLPVFSLDGGLACPQFARILFPRSWSYPAKAVQYFGSSLLCANLILVLAQHTRSYMHNR